LIVASQLLVGLAGFEGHFEHSLADQAVCPAGQTDNHSSPRPYHELNRHTVEQNWTPNYPITSLSGFTGSVLVLHDLIGSEKQICLYGSLLCCAWIVFEPSVAIIANKQ